MREISPRLGVERLGSHVDAVGPRDRSTFVVDQDLREVRRIRQRREHATPLSTAEVDVAGGPVLKGQTQAVLADHVGLHDVYERFH